MKTHRLVEAVICMALILGAVYIASPAPEGYSTLSPFYPSFFVREDTKVQTQGSSVVVFIEDSGIKSRIEVFPAPTDGTCKAYRATAWYANNSLLEAPHTFEVCNSYWAAFYWIRRLLG